MKFTPEIFRSRLAEKLASDEKSGAAEPAVRPARQRRTPFWSGTQPAPFPVPATGASGPPPRESEPPERDEAGRVTRLETEVAEVNRKLNMLLERLDAYAVETARWRQRFDAADRVRAQNLETLHAKLDDTLVLLSTKMDSYAAELCRRHEQTGEALAALARRADAAPLLAAAGRVLITHVDGFILGIPAEEWRMAAYYAVRGPLEPGVIRFLKTVVRPGAVVVDVGANVGMISLYAARLAGDDGKVYSFEPAPRTFALLRENIQVNGLLETGRIELMQMALSDRSATAQLTVYPDNSGHNTFFGGGRSGETIEVATAALDDMLPPGSRVDVIKIDAEGAEPLIWRGMQRVLRDNPGVEVIVEFAASLLGRAGVDPPAFLDEIGAAGFSIERLDDLTGEPRAAGTPELLAAFSTNLRLRRRTS